MKNQNLRMEWGTYAYLKSLVEEQQKKLESDYRTAILFIPSSIGKRTNRSSRSPLDEAHSIFWREKKKLDVVLEELHDAAASTYKDHPNKEMREFWGLE